MNGWIRKTNRPPRKFTWKELSQLNSRKNAHVAYRGKVSMLYSLRKQEINDLYIFRYMMLVVLSLDILEAWIR